MKGILLTTDSTATLKNYEEPLYETIHDDIGGYFEIVRPVNLPKNYVMLVDDCGRLKDLPINPIASLLYGLLTSNECYICGNAIIMKEGFTEEGPDIVDMDRLEAITLLQNLLKWLRDLGPIIEGSDESE